MSVIEDAAAGQAGEAVGVEEITVDKGGSLALADRGDWRSLLLLGATYAAWAGLVFGLPHWMAEGWGAVLATVLIAPVLTLHSSLQHEFLHGHPFRSQRLNDFAASLPIGLAFPYSRFKATHLRHHQDNDLCDPFDDPESWYMDTGEWLRQNRFWKGLLNANNTFAGRLVFGPALGILGLVRRDFRVGRENGQSLIAQWLLHWAACAAGLYVVATFSAIPVWVYLAAAYLGVSLLMVRTFAEHQSEVQPGTGRHGVAAVRRGRSIIVERGGVFAFLFLNNSYHAVHHAAPALAWYRLPERYRRERERFNRMNRGYTVPNYWWLFSRYALSRKEPVPYPGALRELEDGRGEAG